LTGATAYLGREHRGALARYIATVSVCIVPAVAVRWSYYGALVPNTYLAKSAGSAWWDQGLAYLRLYLAQYWALVPALPVALVIAWRQRRIAAPFFRTMLAIGLAIAVAATAIVRVGGDFMFARLFIPLTPLFAVMLERALAAAWPGRTLVHAAAAAAVVVAMHASPRPVDADRWPHGIADEWAVYDPETADEATRDAALLGRAITGLPVRIGFLGGMARVVDGARVPWALDAETGLTDPGIASKTLTRRGRPGHEKRATVDELLARRVHFVIGHGAAKTLRLEDSLPLVHVRLGTLRGFVIHWDPDLFAELRARGVTITDFPRVLDRVIARLPELDDEGVRSVFAQVQRFYFDWVDDPQRRAPFVARLRDSGVH